MHLKQIHKNQKYNRQKKQLLWGDVLHQILQKIVYQNQLPPESAPRGYQDEIVQQLHQNPWQNATG